LHRDGRKRQAGGDDHGLLRHRRLPRGGGRHRAELRRARHPLERRPGPLPGRPGGAALRERGSTSDRRPPLRGADRRRLRSAVRRPRQEDQPRHQVRRHGADRHPASPGCQRPRPGRGQPGIQASPRQRSPDRTDCGGAGLHPGPRAALIMSRPLLASLLIGPLLLAGCANHLPQRSEQEERVERTLITHSLTIDIGEPAVMELPQRRVRVGEQKIYRAKVYEVVRRYDRYTPYQPCRELYEIPPGALAVVAAVGANLLDVVALGNLPESATRDWFDYGFAGLNPALNTESNGRSQQNLAAIEESLRETRTERNSLPWAERPVQVQAGEQE